MSEDIVGKLKSLLEFLDAPPSGRQVAVHREVITEAIAEIEFLRTHAGAVTRGDSFDDILRKTGPQKRGEAS